MPSLRGAPKLPEATAANRQEVQSSPYAYRFDQGGPIITPGQSLATSADLALWRRKREEAWARGEDPDQHLRAAQLLKQEQKDKIKRFFGMKTPSEKNASGHRNKGS